VQYINSGTVHVAPPKIASAFIDRGVKIKHQPQRKPMKNQRHLAEVGIFIDTAQCYEGLQCSCKPKTNQWW